MDLQTGGIYIADKDLHTVIFWIIAGSLSLLFFYIMAETQRKEDRNNQRN